MEINVRPTLITDAAALTELYSQPKAQQDTLQLPLPNITVWQKRLEHIPEHIYRYVAEVDGRVVGDIGFEHLRNPLWFIWRRRP